jgi:hypothetical protein
MYDESIVEENNSKEYSGNIKLRLPKSLHKLLIESAEKEGISLNQYCIYILSEKLESYMLGRKKLNNELIKIRDEVGNSNLDELINAIRPLNTQVEELKYIIDREVKSFLGNRNKVSYQDELDLEFRFPLLINTFSGVSRIYIKVPTIKIVIEPLNNYISNKKMVEDTLAKLVERNKDILLSQVNVDEISFNISTNMDTKDLNSYVIHFLNSNLETVIISAKSVLEELNSISNSNDFVIKFYPTYILEKV